MRPTSVEVGKHGEDLAVQFLIDRGYRIVHRNLRALRHEVDIVARKDQLLIFVEVKARTNEQYGIGLEHVTPAKQKRLARAARIYSAHGQEQVRFDVLSIKLDPDTYRPVRIVHIEDAFRL